MLKYKENAISMTYLKFVEGAFVEVGLEILFEGADFATSDDLSLGGFLFIGNLFIWLAFDNWDGDCFIELIWFDFIPAKSSFCRLRCILSGANDPIFVCFRFLSEFADGNADDDRLALAGPFDCIWIAKIGMKKCRIYD